MLSVVVVVVVVVVESKLVVVISGLQLVSDTSPSVSMLSKLVCGRRSTSNFAAVQRLAIARRNACLLVSLLQLGPDPALTVVAGGGGGGGKAAIVVTSNWQLAARTVPSPSPRRPALRSLAVIGVALDSNDAIDDGTSGDDAKCSIRMTSLNDSVSASDARSRHSARDWIWSDSGVALVASGVVAAADLSNNISTYDNKPSDDFLFRMSRETKVKGLCWMTWLKKMHIKNTNCCCDILRQQSKYTANCNNTERAQERRPTFF